MREITGPIEFKNRRKGHNPLPLFPAIANEQDPAATSAEGPIQNLAVQQSTPDGFLRQFECENYNTCLALAAALNWESFTCAGCPGRVNQQLLWRAHHETRKDVGLASVCQLPSLDEDELFPDDEKVLPAAIANK